ncbi:hypothetical protein ACFE04_016889 [Oxalis oulophora]
MADYCFNGVGETSSAPHFKSFEKFYTMGWAGNASVFLIQPRLLTVRLHWTFSGYRPRAGTGSPIRIRDADHRYTSDFDQSGRDPPRIREFSGSRDNPGRYRDSSPPYGRGRAGGGRPSVRGSDGPGYGHHGPPRGDGMGRNNNPNVRPREGDWFCPDASCGNLNFARREYCNNCKRHRNAPPGSPRRGYPGGPHPTSIQRRRFPGPGFDLSPGRINSHRSPPRAWARDGARDFGPGGPPPPRYGGRFFDYNLRRDRMDYPEDDYRGRGRFGRPNSGEWAHRDGGRDNFRPLPPVSRERWRSPPPRDLRERSRSPIRGGAPLPPPKEYDREPYLDRGRDDRHAVGRNRVGDAY